MSSPVKEMPRTPTRSRNVFSCCKASSTCLSKTKAASAITTRLGPWECISCPAGVIHGFQNDSLAPVYFQVMLGRGKPETMGYADDELYKRKDTHLKAV